MDHEQLKHSSGISDSEDEITGNRTDDPPVNHRMLLRFQKGALCDKEAKRIQALIDTNAEWKLAYLNPIVQIQPQGQSSTESNEK